MKFAICNETFVDWPLAQAFSFARECGYTGVEIAPFTLAEDVRQLSAARRGEVARLAAESDLEVVGLHWLLAKTKGLHLTSPDRGVRRATSEYLVDLAHFCRDLGGSILVFGSPQQRNLVAGVSMEAGLDYAREVFEAVVPVLEETGITLAIEPLGPAEGNFLLTADAGAELVERIGSPNCRLHLDCKAMSTEKDTIPEILGRHAGLLAHFHANDPNRMGPGFGELEFEPILRTLGEIGYQGWVSVEVFDYTPGPANLARQSIEYLYRCLENVLEEDG